MSLRYLTRAACVALGHAQCDCRPLQLLNASFCTVAAPKRIPARNAMQEFAANSLRYSSSVPTEGSEGDRNGRSEFAAPSSVDKFKQLWKSYGVIAVSTYLGIYATTLGSIFFSLEFDLFNAASVGLDPAYAIQKFSDLVEAFTGNTSVPGYIREHPAVGTFAIAWVMTKFTEPLRLGLTIFVVPKVAQWLGRRETHKMQEKGNEK